MAALDGNRPRPPAERRSQDAQPALSRYGLQI